MNKYGIPILNKLNGIYSFIYENNGKIFIVRDPFGVKHLYYTFIDKDIIVGSKIKTIFNFTNKRVINDDGLKELIGMGPSHSLGKTIYKDIYEVKPGNYIIYSKNEFEIIEYYKLPVYEYYDSYENTVLRVKNTLDKTIKSQMTNNNDICCLLSGGLDSSIISKVISDNQECLDTYSIIYTNSKFVSNEYEKSLDSEYTNIVSSYIYSHQNDIYINDEQIIDLLKDVVKLKDGPTMTDIDSSLLYLCQNISENHKICMSGECADEIFGGYPWFNTLKEYDTFPWMNIELKESLLNEKYRKRLNLSEYVKKEFNDAMQSAPVINEDDYHRKLTYINMKYFMLNLLDRSERISSGSGIEIRVPFCDKEVIELLYNVPYEYKRKDGINKKLLRDAYNSELPKEIISRKKSPYPKNNSSKYDEMVKDLVKEVLKDKESVLYKIFDINKINELIDMEEIEPWYGQLMRKTALLAYLYQIDYWFKEYNMRLEE